MSKTTRPDDGGIEPIIADNGCEYPADVYEETARAKYDAQRDVTRAWCDGKLPTHNTSGMACVLYSSNNFKGYQYPDGHGKLKHYRTIEAIRTRNGLVINNTECWSKGWARCSPPTTSDRDYSLPLTTLASSSISDDIYDIEAVEPQVEDTDYTAVFYDGSPGVFIIDGKQIRSSGADLFEALEAAGACK